MAKLYVQRQRRRKTNTNVDVSGLSHRLVPGSSFMGKIDASLAYYAAQYVSKNRDTKIYVSGSNIPGEGELKIVKYIKNIRNDKDSYVVYSSDADSILLSLSLNMDSIYLVSNNLKVKGKKGILSITKVRKYFKSNFNNYSRAIKDFILISALHGNDYIPRYYYSSRLWKIYVDNKHHFEKDGFIVREDNSINFDLLLFLLKKLPEPIYISPVYKIMNRPYESIKDAPDLVLEEDEDYEEEIEAKLASQQEIPIQNSEDVFVASSEYLFGLEWILKSYIQGECICYNWYYPFHSAPHIRDLLFYNQSRMTGTRDISRTLNPNPLPPYKYCLLLVGQRGLEYLSSPVKRVVHTEPLSKIFEGTYKWCLDIDTILGEANKIDISTLTAEEKKYALVGPIQRISFRGNRDRIVVPPVKEWERRSFPVRVVALHGEMTCFSEFATHSVTEEESVVSKEEHEAAVKREVPKFFEMYYVNTWA